MKILLFVSGTVRQGLLPELFKAGHEVVTSAFVTDDVRQHPADIGLWLTKVINRRMPAIVVFESAIIRPFQQHIAQEQISAQVLICTFDSEAVKSSGWQWYVADFERIASRQRATSA